MSFFGWQKIFHFSTLCTVHCGNFRIFQPLRFYVKSQCENFMIFLSLRFYVKSILENLEVQNVPFFNFERLWSLTFMNVCTFWRLKNIKLAQFRAPNMAKRAVLNLLNCPKLISRKIRTSEKSLTFHTVPISVFHIF